VSFNARPVPGRAFFYTFLAIILLSGCAWRNVQVQLPADHAIPDHVLLDNVPFFAQKAYQCGPAALAMMLRQTGVMVTPDELVPMVYVPDRKGSLQSGLISGTRRHDRLAYAIEGLSCLIQEIAGGHPVLVLQNLGLSWAPRWHYAVVVGYDLNVRQVILHTGVRDHRRVRLATFRQTWKRAGFWGLLTLPVGQMPVCAREPDYLKAVLGLQQAGHTLSAVTAFQAAVNYWPQSVNARMALGNAQYIAADLSGAAQSFREAVALKPDNGNALNNLAHTLAELGNLEEALATIQRAIHIAGPHQATYRQTFEEIRKRIEEEKQ
jgi:hypothetical protein